MGRRDSRALEQAIIDDDFNKVHSLYQRVKSLDIEDECRAYPIHFAARLGQLNAIRALAEQGANLNVFGVDDATPIMTAILTGHPDVVQLLLELGAKPEARKTTAHETALLYALWRKRSPQAALYLLEHGADIFATDADGNNAIRRAVFFECDEVLQYLQSQFGRKVKKEIDQASLDFELIDSAEEGEIETVAECLERGANINALDPFGTFALYNAASIGSIPLIDMLLKEGGDINLYGSVDTTALMEAALCGHRAVVDKLLNSGADILAECKMSNIASFSVADFAREGAHFELYEYLLSRMAEAKQRQSKRNAGKIPIESPQKKKHPARQRPRRRKWAIKSRYAKRAQQSQKAQLMWTQKRPPVKKQKSPKGKRSKTEQQV